MPNRKLGRASDQRTAILRNMTTAFVINGKVETTVARAKEISAIVEKLISSAVKEKDNYTTKEIEVSAPKFDAKGKKVLVSKTSKNGNKYFVVDREKEMKTVTVDSASRLAARKRMTYWLLKSKNSEGEEVNPVNKMFDTIAPKYAGRTGGYTRIIRTGARRGDASEMAILEFV